MIMLNGMMGGVEGACMGEVRDDMNDFFFLERFRTLGCGYARFVERR
jgi:hypothetical protein